MIRNPVPGYVALLVFLLLALTGCLKRVEHITVAPDGAVKIAVEYETSAGDNSHHEMYGGDAPPSSKAGWRILEQKPVVDDDGKTKHVLKAERSFAPGATLVASYAKPGDPDGDLYLRFPTELRREKRADGEYFHFARRYPHRRFAEIEAYRHIIYGDAKVREVMEKEGNEVTRADRILMIDAAMQLDARRIRVFARQAFRQVTPDAPQDAWLAVNEALADVHEDVDTARQAALMEKAEDDDGAKVFEAEVNRIRAKVIERLTSTLRKASGYTEKQVEAFIRQYTRNERYAEITEDLRDENFEITVEMPGEIVASNATSVEGNIAKWEIKGDSLAGVTAELMVTSRIAK